MDAPVKENAKNVIRLNRNGLGFSTSGYNGVYRNAWTIDGSLAADFIVAGTMLADRIRGGTLALGGLNNQSGVMQILDASGRQIGRWDNSGLTLTSGGTSSSNWNYSDSNIKMSPALATAISLSGNRTSKNGSTAENYTMTIDYTEIAMHEVSTGTDGNYTFDVTYSPMGVDLIWVDDAGEQSAGLAAHSLSMGEVYVDNTGYLSVGGDLDVFGEKNRAVRTKNYGTVRMSAYETSSPMFGDVGSGQIGDDGQCYVSLDPVFLQTVNTGCEYQVFLQAYGAGELIVSDREPTFFIVCGAPGLNFGWEVKAKQTGYEQNRMDTRIDVERESTGYAAAGQAYYENYVKGLIS